jgi:hypothetical protein
VVQLQMLSFVQQNSPTSPEQLGVKFAPGSFAVLQRQPDDVSQPQRSQVHLPEDGYPSSAQQIAFETEVVLHASTGSRSSRGSGWQTHTSESVNV